MCWCNPNIRTPCCGKPECHPPGVARTDHCAKPAIRSRTREELIQKCAGIIESDLLNASENSKRAQCLADLFIELTGNTGTEPVEPEPHPAKEMKAKIIEFLRSKGDPLWQEIAATDFSATQKHP